MNAVIHYQDGSESIKDIAKSLGANHEVVRMWIKQFEYQASPYHFGKIVRLDTF